jgi:predicted GNAT family acetyltransferase
MVDRMLDWDKPLSEQPEAVRNALKRRITDVRPTDGFDMGGNAKLRDNRKGQIDKTSVSPWLLETVSGNGMARFGLTQKDVDRMFGSKDVSEITGNQILSRLTEQTGSQAKASEYLRQLGIPGIRYLDAGSRGQGGSGTRNFVVFPGEEKKVSILERDGKKLANALKATAAQKQDVEVNLYPVRNQPNVLYLSKIEVPQGQRGQGIGSSVMQDIINQADADGKTITLTPSTAYGATSTKRLKDFYKRFGFVENSGRNKNYALNETMYRLPKKPKE